MYELNTLFSTTDRTHYEDDCAVARQVLVEAGATDVLLCDLISGPGAGAFAWSARFKTLDDVAAYMSTAVATNTDPTHKVAAIRARYQLVNRSLLRTFNEAGERGGPCLSVSVYTSEAPISDDDNKYGTKLMMANGATGMSTLVAVEGESVGRYFSAAYGDNFEQIEVAAAATMADETHTAMMKKYSLQRVNRLLFNVS